MWSIAKNILRCTLCDVTSHHVKLCRVMTQHNASRDNTICHEIYYNMSRHTTACYVRPRHPMSCDNASRPVTPGPVPLLCDDTSPDDLSRHNAIHHDALKQVTKCYNTSRRTTTCHDVPQYATTYFNVSRHDILQHVTTCHIMPRHISICHMQQYVPTRHGMLRPTPQSYLMPRHSKNMSRHNTVCHSTIQYVTTKYTVSRPDTNLSRNIAMCHDSHDLSPLPT